MSAVETHAPDPDAFKKGTKAWKKRQQHGRDYNPTGRYAKGSVRQMLADDPEFRKKYGKTFWANKVAAKGDREAMEIWASRYRTEVGIGKRGKAGIPKSSG